MGRLYIPRLADLCLAAFLLGAAAGAASRADEADYESRIGVLNDCLSIRNGALAPGTPVTIIRFNSQEDEPFVSGDTRERRIAARIVAKTDTAECPAWVEDRTLREDSAEHSLYTISPEIPGMLDSVEFGIGIVGIPPGDEKPIDIDGNGAVDTFSKFVTFGGLVFEVWAGKIWFGTPLWTGSWHYYHGPEGEYAGHGLLDPQVGYVDECLAIRNDALQPGTPIAVMTFSDSDRFLVDRVLDLRLKGTIVAKTRTDEHCPPLSEMRRIESEGLTFYTVALEDGPLMNPEEEGVFGVGIVGVPEGVAWIDLDANGRADSFTACKYYEGLEFVIWSSAPYGGEQLWNDYYYLGYETDEIECPVVPPDDGPDVSGPPRNWLPVFRLGWVHGCFGTSHYQLEPGTPIAIMVFDGDADRSEAVFRKRLDAKIVAKTDSGENCPALEEPVRDANWRKWFGYYTIALSNGESLPRDILGVGIVGPEPDETAFDLDGNGEPDGFSLCNGVRNELTFVAWTGKPHTQGEALSNDAVGEELIWDSRLWLGGLRPAGLPDCPGDL